MRKLYILFLLLTVKSLYSQNSEVRELDVKIQSAHYDFDMFRAHDFKFGIDKENFETLHNTWIWVIIDGFDENNPIDFNNFSLVENELKIRQKPDAAGFKSFYLKKVDLKEFYGEDNFLKFSQEGIRNNDHYYQMNEAFKTTTYRQERFYPLRIPAKKNRKKEFYMNFPVKSESKGEFSLYYKDKLIKTFFMKRGDNLKF